MDPADAHACRAAHCRLAVWPRAHRFSQCCIEWPVAVLLGRIDEKETCQSWLRLPRRHLSPSGRPTGRSETILPRTGPFPSDSPQPIFRMARTSGTERVREATVYSVKSRSEEHTSELQS